ncbi:MAG: hypothetical protein M2R45_02746 [Verrucomicrobia subdivision 3 bacterium]|nr:hypothetical protein [Limisphaerales bacterium]MCS1414296.1 hypothetical protein [Limisphaerales bacterium]
MDAYGSMGSEVLAPCLAVMPSLTIEITGSDVILSWDANARGFVLESADDLLGAWNPIEEDNQGRPVLWGGGFPTVLQVAMSLMVSPGMATLRRLMAGS